MRAWHEYELPTGTLHLLQEVVFEPAVDGFGKLKIRCYGGVCNQRAFVPAGMTNPNISFAHPSETLDDAKWYVAASAQNGLFIYMDSCP